MRSTLRKGWSVSGRKEWFKNPVIYIGRWREDRFGEWANAVVSSQKGREWGLRWMIGENAG